MARQHIAERDIAHPEIGDAEMRRLIVSAIQTAALERPDAIILYGSRARGDNTPDSDYDIFVLLGDRADVKQERSRIRDALGKVITQTGFRVSPLVLRITDLDEHVGIMSNIIEDGVPLI